MLKPGGCHTRQMPRADDSFTPHLKAHISWEQGKSPAQLERQVQVCLEQLLPFSAK